jgi:hypothetical protein
VHSTRTYNLLPAGTSLSSFSLFPAPPRPKNEARSLLHAGHELRNTGSSPDLHYAASAQQLRNGEPNHISISILGVIGFAR